MFVLNQEDIKFKKEQDVLLLEIYYYKRIKYKT